MKTQNDTNNFLIINFIYKDFINDNQYSNRGNHSAAKHYQHVFSKFFGLFEYHLTQMVDSKINNYPNQYYNNLHILEVIKNIKIGLTPISKMKKRSQRTFISAPRMQNVFLENIKDSNLVLRNYWFNQIDSISGLNSKKDIIMTKVPGTGYSNGKFFAKLNNQEWFPKFYGTTYGNDKKDENKVGIYYRPEVNFNTSENFLKYVMNHCDQPNNEIYILGKTPSSPEFLEFRKKHKVVVTTNAYDFYSNIGTFYYSIPDEIYDTIPNSLIHCALNNVQIVILDEQKIMRPSKILKTQINKYNAGFLELNALFNFNHQFWDHQDSREIIKYKNELYNELFRIKSDEKISFNIYYKRILWKLCKNALQSPDRKPLQRRKIIATNLISETENKMIGEFFSYLFSEYIMFNEEQQNIILKYIRDNENCQEFISSFQDLSLLKNYLSPMNLEKLNWDFLYE